MPRRLMLVTVSYIPQETARLQRPYASESPISDPDWATSPPCAIFIHIHRFASGADPPFFFKGTTLPKALGVFKAPNHEKTLKKHAQILFSSGPPPYPKINTRPMWNKPRAEHRPANLYLLLKSTEKIARENVP